MHIPEGKSPQDYWQSVYQRTSADEVSWFSPHLKLSLDLLRKGGLTASSRILDVGGGASTLVDDLLDAGLRDITVLDFSSDALDVARKRLGRDAESVHWLATDLLQESFPCGRFDFWHDRAVLHFLTEEQAVRYAMQAAHAVAPGGHAVIGGFSPDGPERCSGLAVTRRSASDIAALMSPTFRLESQHGEIHQTPGQSEQSFAYALLQRM